MWLYNNIEFTEDMIGDNFGFVYEITNNTNGRKYVGKKFFTRAGTKQIKGKKKKIRLSSGWENYWSSSEELKADVKKIGEENLLAEYYICVKVSQNVHTEKQRRFSSEMLYYQKIFITHGSVAKFIKHMY